MNDVIENKHTFFKDRIQLPGVLLKPRSHLTEYYFPIVDGRDEFSNREQSETNRNDENAMCDYLSDYLRMCF